MRGYVYHIKKEIKARSSESNNYRKTIGSAIRFARINQGLTLEEASVNISSCSYLSKLENNKIKLTPKFKEMFEERLNIQLDKDINLDFEKDLEKILNNLIYKKAIYRSNLEKYNNKFNHESYLINLSCSALNKDYEKLQKSYKFLKSYIVNFSDKELGIFLLALAYAAFDKGYYYTVYEFINLMPKTLYDEGLYALLAYNLKLNSMYKLNYLLSVDKKFEKYKIAINNLQKYDLISAKRDDRLLYQTQIMTLLELKKVVEESESSNSKMNDLFKAIYYFRKQDYNNAENIIKRNIYKNEKWLKIGLLILGSFDNDFLIEVLNTDLDYIITKEDTFILVRYLKKKHFLEEQKFLNFVKNELSTRHNITDNYFVLSFILNDLKNIFTNKSLYKDATETTYRLYTLLNDALKTSNNIIN